MARGSVYDQARYLGKKSEMGSEDQTKSKGGKQHPVAMAARERNKPKPAGMAPREGGKKKSYGRPMDDDKPKLKGGKYK